MLITERQDIKPLLGMDWMREFNWTIRNIQNTTLTDQSEKEKTHFEKPFETNRTCKDTKIKIELKPRHPPIKQKARPIPYHLRSYVEEINKLIQSGYLEKILKIEEDCFVSPVLITVKKDKSVRIALDRRKLNDSIIKMTPHMPNMKEMLNQTSTEITRVQKQPI